MARILVIDDEANIRMMVRLALEHQGHSVALAVDGPEGLRQFKNGGRWDLVLLDQRMPEMEGLDVLREIRSRSPNARVIMITAFGTIDLAVEAMRAGATEFLRKPFTTEILNGAVQAALAHSDPDSTSDSAVTPVTYASTTLNGYRVEYEPGPGLRSEDDLRHTFTLTSPSGEKRSCDVLLPSYVVELIKAHADREELPGGDRFWQAFCESVAANYLWQHSEFPPDGLLRVDDLTAGDRRWVSEVLAANSGG